MADAFKSARLTYRAIEENDEDNLFIHSLRLRSKSRATYDDALFKPVSKASSTNFAAEMRDDSFLAVLICLPPGDGVIKPIGLIGLIPEPKKAYRQHRNADVCVQLLEEYQRKGYGSEAIQWILEWAFKYGGLHRVGITSCSYNPGARRLYERLGFVYEGAKRQAMWFDGGWHDLVLQSMLEDEWRKGQQKKNYTLSSFAGIEVEPTFGEMEKDIV